MREAACAAALAVFSFGTLRQRRRQRRRLKSRPNMTPSPSELALPCSSSWHMEYVMCQLAPHGCPDPGALSRTGNGFAVTSEALGFILVHHKDLAERLRSGLRAKQQSELCRRAGEQTLLTSGCHATTGKEEGGGIFVMMDATKWC